MMSQGEALNLRKSLDRLSDELRAMRERPALRSPVMGVDEPITYASAPQVVTFPNKQNNVDNEFAIGVGESLFDFQHGNVRYIDSDTGKEKEYNLTKLPVVRSLFVSVDQPVSINLPKSGNFSLKGDDQLLASHRSLTSFTIVASRDNTGVRLIASDAPELPVELAKTVNARRIAGFDGSTFQELLTAAMTKTFSPNKEFAVLEVEGAFSAAYTGTLELTKVSRLGSAYDARRLSTALAAANDFYWAPEPEWDFQKGDTLTVELTAQAGCTVSGEAVTDDR